MMPSKQKRFDWGRTVFPPEGRASNRSAVQVTQSTVAGRNPVALLIFFLCTSCSGADSYPFKAVTSDGRECHAHCFAGSKRLVIAPQHAVVLGTRYYIRKKDWEEVQLVKSSEYADAAILKTRSDVEGAPLADDLPEVTDEIKIGETTGTVEGRGTAKLNAAVAIEESGRPVIKKGRVIGMVTSYQKSDPTICVFTGAQDLRALVKEVKE